MKVAFHTLGCRLNQSETAVLSSAFERAGYDLSENGKDADVCVVNTCTVTGASDAKCRSSIRRLIRENPEARVAVIGCYAESGFQAISEIDGVDLIVGNQEKLNLLHYLPESKVDAARVVKDRMPREAFTIDAIGQSTSRARTSLKVQDGCDFMCSFCIIPFVRGRARGRVFENLMEEARQLVDQGFKELVLTGVNVGTYDVDSLGIVDIVDALNELELPRVRISSIEPTTVDEGLLERMNDSSHSLVPYLHLPLQSGSDAVLSAMRRRYTRKDYTDYLEFAHDRVQGLSIGTDVLLGSPEESEEDFEETCSLLTDHPIDYAHAFTYSEREGTPDAKKKQIPMEERKRRTNVVRRISSRKRAELAARHLGQEVEVLVEQHEAGMWEGHLGNYLEIKFPGDSAEKLTNQIVRVKVEEVCGEWAKGQPEKSL